LSGNAKQNDRAGRVAQVIGTCLASMQPWIQTPAPPKKKKKVWYYFKISKVTKKNDNAKCWQGCGCGTAGAHGSWLLGVQKGDTALETW
jgi:hypothetical protein